MAKSRHASGRLDHVALTSLVFPPVNGVHDIDLDYWAVLEEWCRARGAEELEATIWVAGNTTHVASRFADLPMILTVDEGLVTADRAEDLKVREAFEVVTSSEEFVLLDQYARARRLAPSEAISVRDALRINPPMEVARARHSGPLDLIVFDPRGRGHEPFLDLEWADPDLRGVAFVELDVSTEVVNRFDREIKGGGLVPAGRLWGAAGSTRLYRRPESTRARASARLRDSKVSTGAAIVKGRQWMERHLSRPGPLENRKVRWPGPVLPSTVEEIIAAAEGANSEWSIPTLPEEPVDELATEARERFGVYPISFSHPKPRALVPDTDLGLAPIIPGFPYTFEDEAEYLETYASGSVGLTHRKAGWDCFRHVEILAAGAVPLMVDVHEIPRFSMIHYPKTALKMTLDYLRDDGHLPNSATRSAFRDYMLRNLTSEAMASYLMRLAGITVDDNVVFVDRNLEANPEYQSTLTAIGLKQVLGARCTLMPTAEFLYTDSTTATRQFYGRGFGYTRILDPSRKSSDEQSGAHLASIRDIPRGSVVVLGSVSRNRGLAHELIAQAGIDRIVMIHGEDSPPSPEDIALLRASQVTGFVRAIHL